MRLLIAAALVIKQEISASTAINLVSLDLEMSLSIVQVICSRPFSHISSPGHLLSADLHRPIPQSLRGANADNCPSLPKTRPRTFGGRPVWCRSSAGLPQIHHLFIIGVDRNELIEQHDAYQSAHQWTTDSPGMSHQHDKAWHFV